MKKTLIIIATTVLLISSIMFSVTLFVNNLIKIDIINTVVDSDTVTNQVTNSLDSLKDASGITDENVWQEFKTKIQNDDTFNDLTKQYVQTVLNDLLNNENTLDDQEIKKQLLNYQDVVYELTKPNMTKEEFINKYTEMVNSVDLETVHNQIIDKVETSISQDTLKPVKTVYHYSSSTYIYLSLALMITATCYLGFISYQNRAISKGLSTTYITSGILILLLAVGIIFVLSGISSSTMNFRISSIRYMYSMGAIYIILGIILKVSNKVIQSKITKYY